MSRLFLQAIPQVSIALVLVACTPTDPAKTDTGGATVVDGDGDGSPAGEDCDDTNASVSPDAEEICDDVDNNCDGEIDEDVLLTVYGDADGDGFGDASDPRAACAAGEGEADNDDDCDDTDETVFPSAEELCDEVDNDCDGEIDEDTQRTVYIDADGDGHGDPETATEACGVPDGYTEEGDDCDDTSDQALPGGTEICDELDNDCDGLIDEDDATDARTFYADVDGELVGEVVGSPPQ